MQQSTPTTEDFAEFRGYVRGRTLSWAGIGLLFLVFQPIVGLICLVFLFPGFIELRLAHGEFEEFKREYPRLMERRMRREMRHQVSRWSALTKILVILFFGLLALLFVVIGIAMHWGFALLGVLPGLLAGLVIWRWIHADEPSVLDHPISDLGRPQPRNRRGKLQEVRR